MSLFEWERLSNIIRFTFKQIFWTMIVWKGKKFSISIRCQQSSWKKWEKPKEKKFLNAHEILYTWVNTHARSCTILIQLSVLRKLVLPSRQFFYEAPTNEFILCILCHITNHPISLIMNFSSRKSVSFSWNTCQNWEENRQTTKNTNEKKWNSAINFINEWSLCDIILYARPQQ